jgi:peptide/nickel transport system permease protein
MSDPQRPSDGDTPSMPPRSSGKTPRTSRPAPNGRSERPSRTSTPVELTQRIRTSPTGVRARIAQEVRATVEPAVVVLRDPARLSLQLFAAALRSDRRARAGTAMLAALVSIGIVGALIGVGAIDASHPLRVPSGAHPMGTDALGRDVLRTLLAGTLPTLAIGLGASILATLLGVAIGALAGFRRGMFDAAVHRLIESLGAVPSAMLLLVVQLGTPRPGLGSLVLALVLARFAAVAVVVRAEVLRTLELDYVVAARALGAGAARLLARHVLPSALATAMVLSAFGLATVLLLQTAVAAIGVGWVPPTSWGALLGQLRTAPGAWWIALFPGALGAFTVGAAVLLGEALRDALDPRLRGTRDFG